MYRRPEYTSLQRQQTDDQKAREKILTITNYQRNANQNSNEVSPYTGQDAAKLLSRFSRVRLCAAP